MWKCHALARETKLEAISLCQTSLLWLQIHSAKSVKKERQEEEEGAGSISTEDSTSAPSFQHLWLVALPKWISEKAGLG